MLTGPEVGECGAKEPVGEAGHQPQEAVVSGQYSQFIHHADDKGFRQRC